MLDKSQLNTSLRAHLISSQHRVRKIFESHMREFPAKNERLHQAMTYAFLSGGKNLRAGLIYALAENLDLDVITVDTVALAIEMIHTASLIHDDLPSLDNDDTRRGMPACHKKYGEAIAILTGDAFITEAQSVLTRLPASSCSAEVVLKILQHFQDSVGHRGLVAGVAHEFCQESVSRDYKQFIELYSLKTGRLFTLGIQALLIARSHPMAEDKQFFDELSGHIGIIFQLADDLLDINGDPNLLGKPIGSDIRNNYFTLLEFLGHKHAQEKLDYHLFVAHEYIDALQHELTMVHQLLDYFVFRKY